MDDRQEADLFRGGDRTTVGGADEATEQSLGVGGLITRDYGVRQDRALGGRLDRQVIEQDRIRSRRPLRGDRALHLDPAHDQAGLTFRRSERILRTRSTGTGTEETGDVDLDALAGLEHDVEFGDGDIRTEVDRADATQDARRRERVDRDRLGAAALGDVI